jgi:GTPase Era involved in 16S rRNA processing
MQTSNKIAVVAIFGDIKSGKSFLMNQILRLQNSFHVYHKPELNTKGIWIYTEPITIEKDGEILDIFLMDCEGFTNKNDIYSIRLLSLVTSLASLVIFNTTGEITERQLQTLGLVS